MAIEAMSPPEKFSQLRFKSFRCGSDPDYDIMHYQDVIALYNNDGQMCKMFLSTLEGPTMRWYSELLVRSIDYFEIWLTSSPTLTMCTSMCANATRPCSGWLIPTSSSLDCYPPLYLTTVIACYPSPALFSIHINFYFPRILRNPWIQAALPNHQAETTHFVLILLNVGTHTKLSRSNRRRSLVAV